MPNIEVLPSSTTIKTPGWALVPDTGRGTMQAAQPTTGRKRAARNAGLVVGDNTAKQQRATLQHLAELDRDSHKDVQIPVPKDLAGKGSKKTTPNVRRILMSQKTFANHLADEEAALAHRQSDGPSVAASRAPAVKLSLGSKRPSMIGRQALSGKSTSTEPRDPFEDDPLLKTHMPSAPPQEAIEALLTGPPLSYNTARTCPPADGKPQRHFCEICGYWGTIKCMKCGARVCGLSCKNAHDDGRCLKFYV